MAIDEACGLFVERGAASVIRIAFAPMIDKLTIDVSADLHGDQSDPSGLAAEVLDGVTSTWTWAVDGGTLRCA